MLTYELDVEYIVVTDIGMYEFNSEEEKDFFVKCMLEDGFEEKKDFIIYKKIS